MSIVSHVNDAADALGDLLDVHRLLDALSTCPLDLQPGALVPVVDAHRAALKAAMAAVEAGRVALGCPPDIGLLHRL